MGAVRQDVRLGKSHATGVPSEWQLPFTWNEMGWRCLPSGCASRFLMSNYQLSMDILFWVVAFISTRIVHGHRWRFEIVLPQPKRGNAKFLQVLVHMPGFPILVNPSVDSDPDVLFVSVKVLIAWSPDCVINFGFS